MLRAILAIALLAGAPLAVQASESSHTSVIPDVQFSFEGPFGSYDKAALQRGYKIYRQVCSACHSMKRVAFRNLEALGYNEAEIKSIAAEYSVTDGPNDEGEMFERPARASDYFKSPYPNDNAAKYANNGALPPDLSLITKARFGGASYVYGILTGYEEAPDDFTLMTGQHYNKTMSGHVIAMAPPLSADMISYEDGTPQTVNQYAHDVATFLTWAAEPEMEQRKKMGVGVIIFLLAFAGIMYATKRKIWADKH
ncbi:MAG: cytochrome c1 [Alphaproteobacteria bacterium]|nr:cytochrome c1 [Alphaproteobacteria bacterium]